MRETQSTLHKTLENLEKALAEVRCQPYLWTVVTIHVEHLYQMVVHRTAVFLNRFYNLLWEKAWDRLMKRSSIQVKMGQSKDNLI